MTNEDRILKLETSQNKINNYIKVILILAGIFGVGGAFGYNAIIKAKQEIEVLQGAVGNLHRKVAILDDSVTVATEKANALQKAIDKSEDHFESLRKKEEENLKLFVSTLRGNHSHNFLGSGEVKRHETDYTAPVDGIVVVQTRIETVSLGVIVCGAIAGQAEPRASTSILNANVSGSQVYVPYSSFTMPVRRGETWRVHKCGGDGPHRIDILWIPFSTR